ncbi:MAG TPA: DUF302 domain-containing protein [Cyclobacteriaceae bacterium]
MRTFTALLMLFLMYFSGYAQEMNIYRSPLSSEETVEKLKGVLKNRKFENVKIIDQKALFLKDDIEIPPTYVIYFEDNDVIPDIIQCERTSALDMPYKMIVWSESGDTYIGFVDPTLMKRRFMMPDCEKQINRMLSKLVIVANDAIRADK